VRDAWSAVRRNWWRLVFAAVGAVAAVVSYGHIVNLFLKWHQTPLDAHLMPIAIDGLIIIGAGAAKSGQTWLGWSAIGPGLAASLYANVMNGLPYGRGAAMGSGWATIALFLATNVMERWKPAQVSQGGQLLATCGHEDGQTPEQVATNAYLHARDCIGVPISQREIARVSGLHRTKVAALVGPLNGQHP
jgi:hypothetical protein